MTYIHGKTLRNWPLLQQSVPVCIYANQAGLSMLETTPDNLHALSLDMILGSSNNLSLYSVLPTIIQQVKSRIKLSLPFFFGFWDLCSLNKGFARNNTTFMNLQIFAWLLKQMHSEHHLVNNFFHYWDCTVSVKCCFGVQAWQTLLKKVEIF